MKSNRLRYALRVLWRTVLFIPFCCVVAIACAFPFLGRFLVIEAPLQPADAIVVLSGTRATRWMEAVDLFNDRIAPHIVLSSGNVDAAEGQLRSRRITLLRHADLVRNAMIDLGIPATAIEIFPAPVDNTAEEAEVTRGIAEARGWKELLVVTSKYHTRRSRFAFERAFRGSGIHVSVRGTRYDRVTPSRWWQRRFDSRWVLTEVPKLIAYQLGLKG